LSVEKNAYSKVVDDYDKRTEQDLPAGFVRERTTYVAVVGRIWSRTADGPRESFVQAATDSGKWRDVRVIDADDLVQWIERCCATAAWFQQEVLGNALPPGVQNLEDWWSFWRDRSRPPLTSKIVLAGRDEAAAHLRERMVRGQEVVALQADSPEEAIGFAVAAVLETSETDPARELILARGLVVSNPDALPQIPRDPRLCLVTRGQVSENADGLARRGHTVIVPLGNAAARGRSDALRLARIPRRLFAENLTEVGFPERDAERVARECGASITVFQRRYPGGTRPTPEWASRERAATLVPLALLGAWDDSNPKDREVVARIARQSYDDFIRQVTPLLAEDDPPLVRHGSIWALPAPVDVFVLAERFIARPDLTEFEHCVSAILSEVHPRYAAVERRWPALNDQRGMENSEWLRNGLAECVLRLAVLGGSLPFPEGSTAEGFVNRLVGQIPGLAQDPRVLASLESQLTTLAEAAPDPFLDALESLSVTGEFSRAIFRDSRDQSMLFSSSPHSSVLWALETIAWDPARFERVCRLLVRLHHLDPGGQYSNRPLASLREILLPWHPGTSAPSDLRLRVIDDLLRDDEPAGWQLLVSLVPAHSDISHNTHRPVWRDWTSGVGATVTRGELAQTYRELFLRMVRFAKGDAQRWGKTLDVWGRFLPADREAAISQLQADIMKIQSEAERTALWRVLDSYVRRHRSFAKAAWSMPAQELAEIDRLAEQITPPSATERWAWLFDQHLPDLGIERDDLDVQAAEVERLRGTAVAEIRRAVGDDGLIAFIDDLSQPGLVGVAALGSCESLDEVMGLVERGLNKHRGAKHFAAALSSMAIGRFGADWLHAIGERAKLGQWSADQVAYAVRWFPDVDDTISLLNALPEAVRSSYWAVRDGWVRAQSPEVRDTILRGLLSAERAWEIVAYLAYGGGGVTTSLIIDVLRSALVTEPPSGMQGLGNSIRSVIDELQIRADASRTEVAQLEYAYLPALRLTEATTPLLLHRLLATEPEFFVQVLSDVYRGDDEVPPAEVDQERKRRAEAGWDLLRTWKLVPGTEEDGSISAPALREWMQQALDGVRLAKRQEIGCQYIGRILAHSPSEPIDGIWPHAAVREVLENSGNEQVATGLRIEQYNMRGVHSRALFEGGQQERALAATWFERSAQLQAQWPRVATICRSIAEMWQDESRREDVRAEQDRLRWGA
jgi:hypothetical protein